MTNDNQQRITQHKRFVSNGTHQNFLHRKNFFYVESVICSLWARKD